MLDKASVKKIKHIIDRKEPMVVLSHINPDGDAIGSSTALALFFQKQGLPVQVIIPNEVPDFLKWIPGYNLILKYSEMPEKCKELIANASTIFILDFNDSNRLGGLEKDVLNSKAFKVMVDHHQNPSDFTDITISESWRGSAGEMVYQLICDLDGREFMDKDIASSLYVAIMTDTGNFRHSSSYQEVFNVVGDLMNFNIDKNQIYAEVFDSYSEQRMKLMGYCMSEKLVVFPKYHMAYISLTEEELKRYNYQIGDTEGFVNIPFSIKGIKVTALFVEKKDHVRISFRSKGSFSVAKIAGADFKGGGHVNAAGGEDKLPLEETLKKFERIIAGYEKELADL